MTADEARGWFGGGAGAFPIPAHVQALREGGAPFLTEAFHASGALPRGNRVRRIEQLAEFAGGSTGCKFLLTVEYDAPAPGLHRELFVKFSRDFDDPVRDRGRTQMQSEVRFARLSRGPAFPVAVPACYHADYAPASGTGILISQRIGFGEDGIEPHRGKCRDHELGDATAYYRALLAALAHLAAADQSGRLGADLAQQFPFDPATLTVGTRAPATAQALQERVTRYAAFAAAHPTLLPAPIRNPGFIATLQRDVQRFPAIDAAIRAELHRHPQLVALSHWNANLDNAWFRRDAGGALQCGLLDWGCAGRMNLGMALWGALSAARWQMLVANLDALLDGFVTALHAAVGARLDRGLLERHLLLYAASMGVAWLLEAPALIRRRVPQLADVQDPLDPRVQADEMARTQLQMLANFLGLWEGRRICDLLAGLDGANR